ncbi:hypothetical protein [Streptomyces sp. 147326]
MCGIQRRRTLVEWYSPQPESRGDAERLAEAVVGLAFDGLRTAV